jgi:hypothetical protein
MKIRIDRRLPLRGIPSASGIASTPQGLFVIGDDSPWLYRLDPAYRIVDRIRIHAADPETATGRIPKATKPDFEALAVQKTAAGSELFVFGSGSLPRTREVLAIVDAQSPGSARLHEVSAYYAALRATAGIAAGTLNIEAAVICSNALYLFDRGSNVIAGCDVRALRAHLEHGAACPVPRIRQVHLPSLEGRAAGFSGATLLPDTESFLFTASVECSSNPLDDGEILGSFLGILDATSAGHIVRWCELLRDAGGAVLPIKVEAVSVRCRDAQGLCRLLFVTDNDDGDSEMLEATLEP